MSSPCRVLIVDDLDDLRELLVIALGVDARFVVAGEAANGVDAIAKTRELRPDLVLLDLVMPEMSGLEALPHIRQAAPDADVVVLSTLESSRMGDVAIAGGACAYIEKSTSVI